jgi:Zn finger protein HypA/HybF involved in hydrogenase expression
MKISEIITDKYKLRIPPTVYYDLLADVQEVEEEQELKIGHWILTDDDFVYCSECEDSYYPRPIDASWYYCPHCGAKMVELQESEDT